MTEEKEADYIKVLTYNGDTPLLSGTIITGMISPYFTTVRMPADCVTSDYVSDFEDILGLQLEYTICGGQQVSFKNFRKFLYDIDGGERLKEFQICSIVAGQAVPGRYADILLRYPNGNIAVVVPKIQIYDIQRCSSDETYADIQGNYTYVFALDDEEFSDITYAGREGILDVRIYLDEKQAPSVKTYIPSPVYNLFS